jgi:hypothetical protein
MTVPRSGLVIIIIPNFHTCDTHAPGIIPFGITVGLLEITAMAVAVSVDPALPVSRTSPTIDIKMASG